MSQGLLPLASAVLLAAPLLAAPPLHLSSDEDDDEGTDKPPSGATLEVREAQEAVPEAEGATPTGSPRGGPTERALEREAEIFGAPAVDGMPEAGEPASPVQEGDASPPSGLEVIQNLERALDLGGRVYLALQYTFQEEGAPPGHPLVSPSLLDLYADARPSDRVRAFASARLDIDFTAPMNPEETQGLPRQATRVRLDQLWIKLDAGRTAFLTLGKQRIRWGSGRFWNPTDFLNAARLDPLDVFDRRLGVTLAKVHFPLEEIGSNIYFFGVLDDADLLGNAGLASRLEALVFNTEIAVSAALRPGQPLRFGLDVSSGLWLFDLRSEIAFLYGSDQPGFEGPLDFERGVLPVEVSRVDEWIIQALFGGELSLLYAEDGAVTLGAEYFYNDAGYDEPSLYPLLFQRGAFQPLYVGRHYLAGYVALPGPGRYDELNLVASTLANLSDLSVLTRLDASAQLLTFVTLNAWAVAHYGSPGELRLRVTIPPQPAIEGLEDGISLPAPVVDLGAALTVVF